MSYAVCTICPHACRLQEGHTGFCGARKCENGKVAASNYGHITALALDPIEKKPLRRFFPGSMILSAGSYGCNFRCGFCQNHHISMTQNSGGNCERLSVEIESKEHKIPKFVYMKPEELVEKAAGTISSGNIGIAFTYNEPLIGYEYVLDTARLAKSKLQTDEKQNLAAPGDLKIVLVTNGYICEEPLRVLLPWIDAMNIDLKGFTDEYYRKINGDLETVKQTIKLAAESCHVEVTTLIVPDENDSDAEMEAQRDWLASVNPRIPLHISRFFPQYKKQDKLPTSRETIHRLAAIARKKLEFVYEGNM